MRAFTLADFDFDLPPELIAQHPAAERSASRLLDGTGGRAGRPHLPDLPSLLRAGDLLVFNDTRVVKARLFGEKPTGGKLELLVERVLQGHEVVAHMKVSKKPPVGTALAHGRRLRARRCSAAGPTSTARCSACASTARGEDPYALMARYGHVPLPPYITHADSQDDERRYQTVFARVPGAVAAPTAALHFDEALLAALEARGVQRASVTLHVGAGTFQPVQDREHRRAPRCTASGTRCREATQRAIAEATRARRPRRRGRHHHGAHARIVGASSGEAAAATPRIFITPGFAFAHVDLLVTNFHLPKSTLLMLVSAFAGYERVMALYRHAIARALPLLQLRRRDAAGRAS